MGTSFPPEHAGRKRCQPNLQQSPQTELLIRIAETFGVSLDHLAFADRDNTDHAGIADRELLEKLQALDQLPDTERAVVKSVLDTYITKHRIQQLTGTGEPAA